EASGSSHGESKGAVIFLYSKITSLGREHFVFCEYPKQNTKCSRPMTPISEWIGGRKQVLFTMEKTNMGV
ncbi:MAG: hypothetical protein CO060_00055, partial [Candidatus Yonathbacteria bacterium CG_4_9_14_0_2_um_filter_43_16]